MAVDNPQSPQTLQVTLKRSKTDQLGAGAKVFVGKRSCPLYPVAGVLAFIAVRGSQPGPFFRFKNVTTSKLTKEIRMVLEAVGLPYQKFAGHSFLIGTSHSSSH